MKKLTLTAAIASAIGLAGCGGGETLLDAKQAATVEQPLARVVYDPAGGNLNIPNDLLFTGTADGTLNIPVADPMNYGDPQNALNVLDGWSTQHPFPINFNMPAGIALDQASVEMPGSVRIFEATMGGDRMDPDCTPVPVGAGCKITGELTWGVDFVTKMTATDSLVVIPIKPLKPAQSYMMATTNMLMDSAGRSVAGSTTWDLVSLDPATQPLGSDSQKQLQAVVDSHLNVLRTQGLSREEVSYAAAFTTQSTDLVLDTVKKIMIAEYAGRVAAGDPTAGLALPGVAVQPVGINAQQALQLDPTDPSTAAFAAADLYAGQVTLPYFLPVPTAENPMGPVNGFWKAKCDNGIAVLYAGDQLPAQPVSQSDGECMAFGLRDVGIDTDRNLSKYNPIPMKTMDMTLDVQMTVPNLLVANGVRAALGMDPIEMPESGWPLVIVQHGITSQKEHMLGLSGLFSVMGLATIAIDHPLHGSRGFDLQGDGMDDISASAVSATHYMNLASLITARDNLRQSTSDLLGLRLAINALQGAPVDRNNITFFGHSLGAITGVNFLSMTNRTLGEPLSPFDVMFKVHAGSMLAPGGGIPSFLLESGSFGPLIKALLVSQSSPDFAGFLAAQGVTPGTPTYESDLVAAWTQFEGLLTSEQAAAIASTFSSFAFAAQTVLDAADPNNYAMYAGMTTPIHVMEVVGNGVDHASDQVIPNTAAVPLAGTEPVSAMMMAQGVGTTQMGGGMNYITRFIYGHHGSIIDPSPRVYAPDAAMSARVTQEMQTQAAAFLASHGMLLPVTDTAVVLPAQ